MQSADEHNQADLSEQLHRLEYAVRRSMIVREDMDEAADPQHVREAEHVGIAVPLMPTKGELLAVVQTAVRAARSGELPKK